MGATMECELTAGQRLMAESRHMGVEVKLAADRMDELEQENRKLRELVGHLYICMDHYEPDGTISCDRCPLDNCVGNCDYERYMYELGIEVAP